MLAISFQYYQSDFGEFKLASFEGKLCICDWRYRKQRSRIDTRIQQGLQTAFIEKDSPIIQKAIHQLEEYFQGVRKAFDIPLLRIGTDFQKSIWEELLKIPYGRTITYLDLAHKINNPDSIRAVASANAANALSIFIPCHRVIGSDGSLSGYAGGLTAKKKLLDLESGFTYGKQLRII